ncbi:MAG: NAD-dependent epimerase/dehydratase family protein [Lachnospiraceae bacterium]|nr:NAD-dependent epimerase/dehydratase family protein [Lachnospiraceae bacterium]
MSGRTVLITGAAGFIGSCLAQTLLKTVEGIRIVGVDNMNDYYDVSLKEYRLKETKKLAREKEEGSERPFLFIRGDIGEQELVRELFERYRPEIVVNLAAQAGVRYSITNPDAYIESNLVGFYNILEGCRHSYDYGQAGVRHLLYASSSSVYGSNRKVPYSVEDKVDHPVSLYAATKKSNELLAHAYGKLYGIPSTGLRFFTVYGPAGRPDMAYFGFTDKLVRNEKIRIFNYGNCRRDFTYIDDIVTGVMEIMCRQPGENPDGVRYKIYNIGNNHPENLMDFVDVLSKELKGAGVLPEEYDLEAHMELVEMQPGDVETTYADTTELERDFGFKPETGLREGLRQFAQWYKDFYGQKA